MGTLGEAEYRLGQRARGKAQMLKSYRMLTNDPKADSKAKDVARRRVKSLLGMHL